MGAALWFYLKKRREREERRERGNIRISDPIGWHYLDVEPYTRHFSWWRFLNPINLSGFLSGTGSCRCGNIFRQKHTSFVCTDDINRGFLICADCYNIFEREILTTRFNLLVKATSILSSSDGRRIYKKGMTLDEYLKQN